MSTRKNMDLNRPVSLLCLKRTFAMFRMTPWFEYIFALKNVESGKTKVQESKRQFVASWYSIAATFFRLKLKARSVIE